jgi:hypothetical protein
LPGAFYLKTWLPVRRLYHFAEKEMERQTFRADSAESLSPCLTDERGELTIWFFLWLLAENSFPDVRRRVLTVKLRRSAIRFQALARQRPLRGHNNCFTLAVDNN